MANFEHLAIVSKGVEQSRWESRCYPDLRGANLMYADRCRAAFTNAPRVRAGYAGHGQVSLGRSAGWVDKAQPRCPHLPASDKCGPLALEAVRGDRNRNSFGQRVEDRRILRTELANLL